MRRTIAALVLMGVAATAVLGSSAGTAGAGGGTQLQPDRDFYRPGEPVHLSAAVDKLDRDWFGPYTVYIRPIGPDSSSEYVQPGLHADDRAVGRLVVTRLDERQVRAEVTFVLPKVGDGWYLVGYCGPDCSKPLGNLSSSWFYVGTAPDAPETVVPAPTTVVTAPTTVASTRPAPPSTVPTTASTTAGAAVIAAGTADPPTAELAWWAVVATAVVVLAGLGATLGFGRRRRTIGTSAMDGHDAEPEATITIALDPDRPVDEAMGARR